ncbi:MAG: ATP-dependent endonuclease, partial [Treponema sp.]|nr:ATP-dependent endonuclease [Treponema sp.]
QHKNAEMFFAEKVILVEGEEQILIPEIVKGIYGKNILNNNDISIIKVGGKTYFDIYVMKKDGSSYRPFYFGDWKSLKISGDGLRIDGTFYGTKRLTQSGQRSYRNENDYQEKSALGLLLADFQHAYSNGEPDYYYDTLCYAIMNQLNKYVYDIIFRPTPRMILDMREDSQTRYNH